MTTLYTPTRSAKAILLHAGDLRSNLLGGNVPPQFFDLQDTVAAGSVGIGTSGSAQPYVAPDAAVVTAMGYDEIVIDVQPIVRADGSVGAVTSTTQNAFRQIALADRPYWIVVRCDGYGIVASGGATSLGNTMALRAYTIASNVANWALQHCASLIMTSRLMGFAFLTPDLNVRFPDRSVVDRTFQNRLVQLCWSLGRSCTFVTSRPADATSIVAPPFGTDDAHLNVNSGQPLQYPIVGTNPAHRDRIMVLYPVVQSQGQQAGVLLGMLAGVVGARGRDPGFPLNMDVAFVVPALSTQYASDGVVGTNNPSDTLRRACIMAAACGVVVVGTTGGATLMSADRFLPDDDVVNTTGAFSASSTNGITTIRYADVSGAAQYVERQFESNMEERGVA